MLGAFHTAINGGASIPRCSRAAAIRRTGRFRFLVSDFRCTAGQAREIFAHSPDGRRRGGESGAARNYPVSRGSPPAPRRTCRGWSGSMRSWWPRPSSDWDSSGSRSMSMVRCVYRVERGVGVARPQSASAQGTELLPDHRVRGAERPNAARAESARQPPRREGVAELSAGALCPARGGLREHAAPGVPHGRGLLPPRCAGAAGGPRGGVCDQRSRSEPGRACGRSSAPVGSLDSSPSAMEWA